MVKPANSRQMKSEKTKEILQQVESERQYHWRSYPRSDHVADQDADNDGNQGHVRVMSKIPLSWKNPQEST